MSLLPSNSRRALQHTRTIQIDAFIREDGLWELDAHITDIKSSELKLIRGVLPAGEPLHNLWLRLTLDHEYNIVEVAADSEAVPYPGHCNTIAPAYNQLVGLCLLKGFRYALRERIGGAMGCTHLTELAQILPTAALQAFSGESPESGDQSTSDAGQKKPFQVGSCHALRRDGAIVAKYYPRWAIHPTMELVPAIASVSEQDTASNLISGLSSHPASSPVQNKVMSQSRNQALSQASNAVPDIESSKRSK
ncbi:DUF2889 domain-containing protein [Glaciimonas immobilis]|uniref:DUF2889 domain-containing protein n=1 Tax=Glaciimonas immobilis TaxID=728004 RepID=A0A840RYA6_9BURK|nr:DUF2889 domain-containing protein [Glaciimonas immobilis]KAF3998566.1 DUF2889 domain-containing protein [Glaciimonas immobilis]MBB5201420.1 hypothetical protein [Glaciimonas immobilis]